MNFWLHEWRLNRFAHSRIIQIVDIKYNMGKTFDKIQKQINNMSKTEKMKLQMRLNE